MGRPNSVRICPQTVDRFQAVHVHSPNGLHQLIHFWPISSRSLFGNSIALWRAFFHRYTRRWRCMESIRSTMLFNGLQPELESWGFTSMIAALKHAEAYLFVACFMMPLLRFLSLYASDLPQKVVRRIWDRTLAWLTADNHGQPLVSLHHHALLASWRWKSRSLLRSFRILGGRVEDHRADWLGVTVGHSRWAR